MKDNYWIDDVIKQHKQKLDEIKKSRNTLEDISEEIPNSFSNLNLLKSKEVIRNSNENKSDKNYMNITENYVPNSEENEKENNKLNFDYKSDDNIEYDRYKTYQSTLKSTIEDESQFNILKAKLETKKLRLRELKKQFDLVCEENANLKYKISDLERHKHHLDNFEKENSNFDKKYVEREREFVNTIQQLEQDKTIAEDRLKKILSMDNIKTQEIELMHQKITDFELILDENQNEYIESIKNLKSELDEYKNKHFENEKFFDILNYFFKKIQSYYGVGIENEKNIKSDPKFLQNKLIELENFINKLINDKSNINQKYSKVLNIQSKLTQGDSLDTSQLHLDNVKKLNEKIFDLSEENKFLRQQIENNICEGKSRSSNSKSYDESVNYNLKKTDKENIFTNNLIKEKTKIKNLNTYNDDDSLSDNKIINTGGNIILDSYKTLEQRVMDLEKELKIREKIRDNSVNTNNMKKLNLANNNINTSSNIKRSKSTVKKVVTPLVDKKEKVESKIIKTKKKTNKVKSSEQKEPKKEKSNLGIKKTDHSNISITPSSKSNIRYNNKI